MLDLKVVLEQYPQCLERRTQLAGLLRDLYPDEKRQVNIVLDVYQCGIAARISQMKEIDTMQMRAFIQQLDNEHGLQEQYAIQGIELWASAYGIKVSHPSTFPMQAESNQSTPFEHLAKIVHNPNAYSKPQMVTGASSDYELKTLSDGTLEIVKFIGFDQKDMVVPNTIDGKKVTWIGNSAFSGCTSMLRMSISEGIQHIGDRAFENCKNLEKVFLSPSLSSLGELVFHNCEQLIEVEIPNGILEIRRETFSNCENLKSVLLPNHLKTINHFAFSRCDKIESIIFPNSLLEIKPKAFLDTSLKRAILNEGLISIGEEAFYSGWRSPIPEIVIPNTVKEIGKNAFNRDTTLYCYAGSEGLAYARRSGNPIKNAAELIK